MIDGYNVICEFFNTRKDEKVLKSYPIMDLSIYRGDKLVTKRYLVARISITNRKITIDRLSSIVLIPAVASIEHHREILHSWKPHKSVDIPYKFIKSLDYDPDTKSLIIETFMDNMSIFVKMRDTEYKAKEIKKLTSPYLN